MSSSLCSRACVALSADVASTSGRVLPSAATCRPRSAFAGTAFPSSTTRRGDTPKTAGRGATCMAATNGDTASSGRDVSTKAGPGGAVLEAAPGNAGAGAQKKVKGKTVVVTGGSQGIGRETALLFARKGYNVVVVARQQDRLEEVARAAADIRGRPETALALAACITDPTEVERIAREVSERFETVDVVVNNAGVCHTGAFLETDFEVYKKQVDINFLAHVAVSQAFASKLIASKGHLVFVNSFGAVVPLKFMSAYSASKYALAGFADVIRYELKPLGVGVHQVHPGVTKSSFMDRAGFTGTDAAKNRSSMQQLVDGPMAHESSDVADAVWRAIEKNKDETIVGAFFSTAIRAWRLTGLNVFAAR